MRDAEWDLDIEGDDVTDAAGDSDALPVPESLAVGEARDGEASCVDVDEWVAEGLELLGDSDHGVRDGTQLNDGVTDNDADCEGVPEQLESLVIVRTLTDALRDVEADLTVSVMRFELVKLRESSPREYVGLGVMNERLREMVME